MRDDLRGGRGPIVKRSRVEIRTSEELRPSLSRHRKTHSTSDFRRAGKLCPSTGYGKRGNRELGETYANGINGNEKKINNGTLNLYIQIKF